MESKTNFFLEAPETVSWLDLTDPDPPYFTTDLHPRGHSWTSELAYLLRAIYSHDRSRWPHSICSITWSWCTPGRFAQIRI